MRKIILTLAFASVLLSCKPSQTVLNTTSSQEVNVSIDLNNIKDDKVLVTILTSPSKLDEVTFNIPKTVPGTYSLDNYGKYIEAVKAFDTKGNALILTKIDENSWKISNAKTLAKVTYLVNDTFDTEKGGNFGNGEVFSPAGSNISADNFMINTHAFVGYFSDKLEIPYTTTVNHSATLYGATSMVDLDASTTQDVFKSFRYADYLERSI